MNQISFDFDSFVRDLFLYILLQTESKRIIWGSFDIFSGCDDIFFVKKIYINANMEKTVQSHTVRDDICRFSQMKYLQTTPASWVSSMYKDVSYRP